MAKQQPKPKPDKTPFERFQQLAQKLLVVPKEKVSKASSKDSESS